MERPVLFAVEIDADHRLAVDRELQERYGHHYDIECVASPDEAADRLRELAAGGRAVAVVLAAQQLGEKTGGQVLDEVRALHPHARRALLVDWGEWGQHTTGEAIFDGIAHGRFDHYVLRPTCSPDELFHQSVSSLLLEWAEANRAAPYTVHIVGESWSGRAYELREALQQCAVPHNFCLVDSDEGSQILERVGPEVELPIMVFPNGEVLANPSNEEVAVAAGGTVDPARTDFDLVVVGA